MNARLRVVIADDERPARSFLAALLRSFEDVVIVAEAETGKEAVAAIERERPDLALLDLQMPELDGIGVVRMLKKTEMPLIAFVTAYDEYAVRAFEVNAVDYLLKPVEKTRLREAINRAQERIEHAEIVAEQSNRVGDAIAAYESSSRGPYLERIPVRRRDEILIVQVAQIASIVAEGELLYLTTTKNERHAITYRLKDLEARLDPARFIRLGRGTLANVDLDRQGERHAGRHARGAALERPEAAGEPAAVAHHPRALPEAVDTLERDPDSPVDVPAVERRPRIDGPASVESARRPNQRIPIGLLHVREVFAVDEQPIPADAPFDEGAKYHVRFAFCAIRVRLEPLSAGVIPLEADAAFALGFPHADESCAVAWRQRQTDLHVIRALECAHVRVGRRRGERRSPPRAEQLGARIGDRRLEIAQARTPRRDPPRSGRARAMRTA